MTLWGPAVSLVLIASPEGFPRQPDRTQNIHAFRANPAVQAQSTQWIAGGIVQQVVETEFEARRPHPEYALLFGRTVTTQPVQPWSIYKWTSPVPSIDEFRPQWTNHNLAYAPFQTRTGLTANQPWSVYRWQIPTPDTTPYVEYRSRDFWADYLAFTITPTNPVLPGQAQGPMGAQFPSGYFPMARGVGYNKPKKEETKEDDGAIEEIAPQSPKIELKRPILTLKKPRVDIDALIEIQERISELSDSAQSTQDALLSKQYEEEAIALLLLM